LAKTNFKKEALARAPSENKICPLVEHRDPRDAGQIPKLISYIIPQLSRQ